jgi:hypothetical protein
MTLVLGQRLHAGLGLPQGAQRVVEGITARSELGEPHEIRQRAPRVARADIMLAHLIGDLVRALAPLRLQRFGHRPMQHDARRRHDALVGDVPDALVRDVEALTDGVQDPPAHELLDRFRRLARAAPGRGLEQCEIELAADDRGRREDCARALAEPIEAGVHELLHPPGQRQPDADGDVAVLEGAHRLDDDERVASARVPHALAQSCERRRITSRSRDRLHERHGLRTRQPLERDAHDSIVALAQNRAQTVARLAHQLLVTQRGQHGDRLAGESPAQEHEKTHAQRVRPVQVLEHDENRTPRRNRAKERGDRLEQPCPALRRRRSRRDRAELGKQPRQLDAPRLADARALARLRDRPAAAQRIDPRAERQLLTFPRASDQHAIAVVERARGQLLHEPALADAGFARDDREHAASGARTATRELRPLELGGAADQRDTGHGHRGSPRRAAVVASLDGSRRVRRRGGGLRQQRSVQRARLRFGLDAELLAHDGETRLVLPQRGAAASLRGIEPHERAMNGLLQRVQSEQAHRRLNRALRRRRTHLQAEQSSERVDGLLAKTHALGR